MLDVAPVITTHWRHIFWVFGIIGVVWCTCFWLWFTDRPEQHSQVNDAELALIHFGDASHNPAIVEVPPVGTIQSGLPKATPLITGISEGEPPLPLPPAAPPHPESRLKVPWGKLIRSPNLWLICMMYFCASYGWYFNITYLPGFIKDRMEQEGLNVVDKWTSSWWQYSLMAGLPLLFGSLACIVGGFMTDSFIKRTGNRKWGRRLFGVGGHGLCAVFYFLGMLVMGFDNPWPFVLLIATATFWNDMTMGAAWASCIDIGRRYSGIVSGCMNTIGNLGGFTANICTGYILKYYAADIKHAWVVNFLIFTGVYVMAAFLWMGFDATKPIDEGDGAGH